MTELFPAPSLARSQETQAHERVTLYGIEGGAIQGCPGRLRQLKREASGAALLMQTFRVKGEPPRAAPNHQDVGVVLLPALPEGGKPARRARSAVRRVPAEKPPAQ